MPTALGAKVVAVQKYRLKTLNVHDDWLVLVIQGRKVLHAAQTQIEARTGQCVLIARGSQWDVVNDPKGNKHYEAVALSFPSDIVQKFNDTHPFAALSDVDSARVLAHDEVLQEAVMRMLAPMAEGVSQMVLTHRVMEVLLLLALKGWRFRSVAELSWVERVRRMVAQSPQANWSVDVLCEAFHMSESSLRRRLKDSGLTLARLVREVRSELALGMLQTTTLPVGEVALRCGWDSHSRFSAAFTARWGVSPSTVRGSAV